LFATPLVLPSSSTMGQRKRSMMRLFSLVTESVSPWICLADRYLLCYCRYVSKKPYQRIGHSSLVSRFPMLFWTL
jgi:hypothetical protein